MKASLGRFIEMVNEKCSNHHDQIIPLSSIEFESLEKARIFNGDIEVLPSAQRLIANRLRIPHQYLIRCPQSLQEENLNYWLNQERQNRETFFCRFDGYRLRAVFTERYTAFDNKDILTRMVEYGFDMGAEVHYKLNDSLMVLQIPEYDRMFSFPGNDRMVPGITLANSEVGLVSFGVEGYFYRLVCSNGLISETSFAKRFKHVSSKAVIEFDEVLSNISMETRHTQRRLRMSTETVVHKPEETFETFNRRFQITKKEAEIVNSAFEQERGNTMFHIINAYTRGAQFPTLTTEETYKLQKVGGLIVALVK